MMTRVFHTDAEKERGLRVYQGKHIPRDVAFVFPFINGYPSITTTGLNEAIHVYVLDGNFRLLTHGMLYPNQNFLLPAYAEHVVETSAETYPITDFSFVGDLV